MPAPFFFAAFFFAAFAGFFAAFFLEAFAFFRAAGFFAAFFFGFFAALQYSLQRSGIPSELMQALPYVAALVALAGFAGRVRAPAADGVPYERS